MSFLDSVTSLYNNIKDLSEFLNYITPENITQYDPDLILKISNFAKEILIMSNSDDETSDLSPTEIEIAPEINENKTETNTNLTSPKQKDVLLENFLNNNLNLENYHYLISVDPNRIHTYCDNCFVY
jgi:hypothetical protein